MRNTLGGINLLPLVDVILVLLAAFMVAAPMMQQGTSVELPKAGNAGPLPPEALTVTVPYSYGTDRRVQVGYETIELDTLPALLRAEMASRRTGVVHLRGHRAITYEQLVQVIDRILEAGAESVELVLEPLRDDNSEATP